jgi:hypothetical protein
MKYVAASGQGTLCPRQGHWIAIHGLRVFRVVSKTFWSAHFWRSRGLDIMRSGYRVGYQGHSRKSLAELWPHCSACVNGGIDSGRHIRVSGHRTNPTIQRASSEPEEPNGSDGIGSSCLWRFKGFHCVWICHPRLAAVSTDTRTVSSGQHNSSPRASIPVYSLAISASPKETVFYMGIIRGIVRVD